MYGPGNPASTFIYTAFTVTYKINVPIIIPAIKTYIYFVKIICLLYAFVLGIKPILFKSLCISLTFILVTISYIVFRT